MPHGSMPPGFSPADWCVSGVRHGPTRPLRVARSTGYMYSGASSHRRVPAGGDQPVWAVDLEVPALERRRWVGAPRSAPAAECSDGTW